MLHVEFDKKKVKLKPELHRALLERLLERKTKENGDWWKLEGCVVCDDVLNAQTSAKY